ncbi:hypothetical protein O181_126824 [Austropuccinia psidii MF-1]|uniref:Uncharacterized protein n=1 Tax=Austropuccinia psidii MF-1 TaxID=1389203 RepID=A0A9Q3KWS8_9BASI|nr:hypothetical protein [Austropuccinia psidii MF-1]
MYGIDIYNSKNMYITIGTNKEKKPALDIYQLSIQDAQKELLHQFKEGQFSASLTIKQKFSLLKNLTENRPDLAIGEEPLGKMRGNAIEIYLDVERPYPPMLRGLHTQQVWELGRKLKNMSINYWKWISSGR